MTTYKGAIKATAGIPMSGTLNPRGIVIHYTAGNSAKSSIDWWREGKSASAHVVIDRDGTVYQTVPFNRIAWHAGRSSYRNFNGLNEYAIGIEIANWGILTKKANGKYYSAAGTVVDPKNVISAKHANERVTRFWESYTEAQIESVIKVIKAIKALYPNIGFVVGHSDITGRKLDPGPAAPMDKFKAAITSAPRAATGPDMWKVSSKSGLNLRAWPSTESKILTNLPDGAEVKFVRASDGWFFVEYNKLSGWVDKDYLIDV